MNTQLVFQFPANELTDFDQLLSLENAFQVALGLDHLVDGHDFGSDEMNIFVHTDDANRAFELCIASVPANLRLSMKAAYRSFSEDQYHWLYPKTSIGEFKVV